MSEIQKITNLAHFKVFFNAVAKSEDTVYFWTIRFLSKMLRVSMSRCGGAVG